MKGILISNDGKANYVDKPEPKIKRGWAKIKIMSSGLCGSDITKIFSDRKSRLAFNKNIWGHEFSGIVEGIEKNSIFNNGDRVVIQPLIFENYNDITEVKSLGKHYGGGFSNYALVPIKNLRKIPNNLTFDLAALVEPIACSLHAYHLAGSPKNKKVLIIGDGTIALNTLIICKKFYNKVTLFGKNKANLNIAKKLGATALRNSSKLGPSKFDFTFECVGRSQDFSLQEAIGSIRPGGRIVVLGVFKKGYKNKLPLRELFFKEGLLLGSNCYLPEDFDASLKILENEKSKFEKIITHILPLKDFEYGLNLIKNRKKSQAIKIIFNP